MGEIGDFDDVRFVDGRPVKPNMTTLNVNLYGVLYSMHAFCIGRFSVPKHALS